MESDGKGVILLRGEKTRGYPAKLVDRYTFFGNLSKRYSKTE